MENSIFTNLALLSRDVLFSVANTPADVLPEKALKFEIANTNYERAIERSRSGKTSPEEVERNCVVKDLLRDAAITYAVENKFLPILGRLKAKAELDIVDYPDGSDSYTNSTGIVRQYYDSLTTLSSTPSILPQQSIFALNKLKATAEQVKKDHYAAQAKVHSEYRQGIAELSKQVAGLNMSSK